ncbi:MAG: phenylacetate-CoA oxygenase subunit PaaJ [Bacteroidota bacterium]
MVTEDALWSALEEVMDPEVPVLSVVDLGVIRRVSLQGNALHIDLAPTYTGCPAMDVIQKRVEDALGSFGEVHVQTVLDPPWTTDWMTASGREKLEAYGIAPPVGKASDKRTLWAVQPAVGCPRCKSENTELISLFGSTACKSLYKCRECHEPFDYFKCL